MEVHRKRAPLVWGFWERLIGLTKTVLKKMLVITLQVFLTLIAKLEAVLHVNDWLPAYL